MCITSWYNKDDTGDEVEAQSLALSAMLLFPWWMRKGRYAWTALSHTEGPPDKYMYIYIYYIYIYIYIRMLLQIKIRLGTLKQMLQWILSQGWSHSIKMGPRFPTHEWLQWIRRRRCRRSVEVEPSPRSMFPSIRWSEAESSPISWFSRFEARLKPMLTSELTSKWIRVDPMARHA